MREVPKAPAERMTRPPALSGATPLGAGEVSFVGGAAARDGADDGGGGRVELKGDERLARERRDWAGALVTEELSTLVAESMPVTR
jgi:hypothetical protein